MSSYNAEHNIHADSDDENEAVHRPAAGRLNPTLNEALAEFLGQSNRPGLTEQRRLVHTIMSYIVPNGNPALLEQMLTSMINSGGMLLSEKGPNGGGVDDKFLDMLDRVPVKDLPEGARCPICTNDFRNDKYPLVVRLPCDSRHVFDLECISPWLKTNRTCPMCREDVTTVRKRRLEALVKDDEEDEEEDWDMYG